MVTPRPFESLLSQVRLTSPYGMADQDPKKIQICTTYGGDGRPKRLERSFSLSAVQCAEFQVSGWTVDPVQS